MVLKSSYPAIKIPEIDVLTYLFGSGENLSDSPLWINSTDPSKFLSLRRGLQWIKRLGVALTDLGVKTGEVVMLVSPNHIFVPVAYLGVVGHGFIFSGANPIYTAEEMAYQMKDTGAKVVLVHPVFLENVRTAARQAGLSDENLLLFSDTENDQIGRIGDWRSILPPEREVMARSWPTLSSSSARNTVATVNYSSGTTGLPKGVMISHFNLVANAERLIAIKTQTDPGNDQNERWIGFLPLYHAYGQLWAIIMAAKRLIPDYIMSAFDFEDMLRVIQEHKITKMMAVPPILVLRSKHPAVFKYDLSSLTRIGCGAAPLSQDLQNEISDRFKVIVAQGWGMTEVTCAGITVPECFKDSTGSVGSIMPGCEVKLLGQSGEEVGLGERGEVYIRGPNISSGYWRNEKATRESMLEGGWLRTGDVAINDQTGRFWIVDRLKELIKVSAFQVAPAELEAVLLTHPAMADAGAIGMHQSFSEQELVRAYIQLKRPGSVAGEELQEWMKSRVAEYKWLTGGVVFVPAIPKSAAGKIQRKVLREWGKGEVQQVKARM